MSRQMAGEHTIHWVAYWKLQKTSDYQNSSLHKTMKRFETKVCVLAILQTSTIKVNGDKILHQSEKCLISKVMRPNYCSIVVSMRNAYNGTLWKPRGNEKHFPTM